MYSVVVGALYILLFTVAVAIRCIKTNEKKKSRPSVRSKIHIVIFSVLFAPPKRAFRPPHHS